MVAGTVRALARDPDRHVAATGIPARDRAAGLHRHRDVALLADRVGDDVGRGVERRAQRGVVGRRGGAGHVGVELVVHQLVVVVDREPQVDRPRARFVLDVDQLARVLGERPALGDDEDDRVADEAHDAARHRTAPEWARVQGRLVGRRREIVERVDGDDPGHRRGFGGVDAGDRGARMRAADERDVQHAGKDDVVGVEPATGEETRVFLARHPRPDESARFHLDETGLVPGVLLGRRQRSRS